ncbi:unnamed protein product [Adineta steineri]|uniref:G-protein coupled receptors family 1 profile domain-containing protein n=1 Tax=Adineta steineri TaxID=433720 RepID=A0A814GYP9_9BILA|nr:unnamed protein product [Adineta steineri]
MLPTPYLIFLVEGCASQEQTPYWLRVYTFALFIIGPLILNAIFNSLILIMVRASSRRVAHAVATTTTGLTTKMNHSCNTRDLRLIKHMLFIFFVNIFGWGPAACILLLNVDDGVILTVSQYVRLPPLISSFIVVIDLFVYNRDLTKYLKEKIFKYLHIK